jgi:hypothetical protein
LASEPSLVVLLSLCLLLRFTKLALNSCSRTCFSVATTFPICHLMLLLFLVYFLYLQGDQEDEQFKVINKFLTDTEEYLNKLVTKLAKLQAMQDSQEYVQKVMEEARRGKWLAFHSHLIVCLTPQVLCLCTISRGFNCWNMATISLYACKLLTLQSC